MGKKIAVPDAWDDDDWEVHADKAEARAPQPEPTPAALPMTKEERMAKHAEMNRKLWESAYANNSSFSYLPCPPSSALAWRQIGRVQ